MTDKDWKDDLMDHAASSMWPVNKSALDIQEGGSHYKDKAIQPVEYCMANNIPFMEGSAIKYLTRWRDKGGIQDLKKARHFIDMLIEWEEKQGDTTS